MVNIKVMRENESGKSPFAQPTAMRTVHESKKKFSWLSFLYICVRMMGISDLQSALCDTRLSECGSVYPALWLLGSREREEEMTWKKSFKRMLNDFW